MEYEPCEPVPRMAESHGCRDPEILLDYSGCRGSNVPLQLTGYTSFHPTENPLAMAYGRIQTCKIPDKYVIIDFGSPNVPE